MILTFLTKDYVVQASDRRISYLDGKTPPKDDSNKALVYGNNFVFAYTGRAQLVRTPTIDWAAQRLSERDNLNEAIHHLKDRATSLVQNFYSGRPPHEKMVGFVGAGFAETEENGRWYLKPLRIMISNFTEQNDTWLPHKEFRIVHEALQVGRTFKLFVSGRPLAKERRSAINNILTWCLRHKKAQGPETIGRFLAREILKAAEADGAIGTNIMCTFVPRAFINDGSISVHLGSTLMETPRINAEPQRLQPANPFVLHDRFVIPPPFDRPRMVYIDNSNNPLPSYTPLYVRPGQVIPTISMNEMSLTIPPVIQIPDTSIE